MDRKQKILKLAGQLWSGSLARQGLQPRKDRRGLLQVPKQDRPGRAHGGPPRNLEKQKSDDGRALGSRQGVPSSECNASLPGGNHASFVITASEVLGVGASSVTRIRQGFLFQLEAWSISVASTASGLPGDVGLWQGSRKTVVLVHTSSNAQVRQQRCCSKRQISQKA